MSGNDAPGATAPGAAPSPPQQSEASMMIPQMIAICKRFAQANPQMADGLQMAIQGLNKANSDSLMTQPATRDPQQNPPY